jgi:hypothetical protein
MFYAIPDEVVLVGSRQNKCRVGRVRTISWKLLSEPNFKKADQSEPNVKKADDNLFEEEEKRK